MSELKRWKTRNKFPGIAAIILVYFSMAAGTVQVFQYSAVFGTIEALLVLFWPLPTVWFYCRKCLCRLDCGHVLMGFLSRFMPEIKPEKIKLSDALPALIPMAAALVLPQYWLWMNKFLFLIFWALIAVGGILSVLFVCKHCSNECCPLNRVLSK